MRNSLRIAAMGTALAAVMSFVSTAQAATTATGQADAEILTTLQINATRSLDFGQVAVNGAGAVTVAPNGGVTCGATLICTGTRTSAQFEVQGTDGVLVNATIAPAPVLLTGPGANMSLTGLTANFPNGNTLAGVTLLNVGGTLNVNAAQTAGNYTGQFSVSVEYQ